MQYYYYLYVSDTSFKKYANIYMGMYGNKSLSSGCLHSQAIWEAFAKIWALDDCISSVLVDANKLKEGQKRALSWYLWLIFLEKTSVISECVPNMKPAPQAEAPGHEIFNFNFNHISTNSFL